MENKFYGEWVYFENDEEKEEAILYLKLWKKFLLKQFHNMHQVGQDQIVIKNYIEDFKGNKLPIMTLGIKIELKVKDET